ncbi:hypothetical protein A374_18149 [Fictibacillus macauensis ZFHKF-1]|uniref:Uncharacterized protein n=1 Tax=Fictibacillus macauensis ZFHKF-1 TaxID=1196324 RepID=I8UB35_9BACL|nr:hypothetical protein [Fictibacillus macauensis]EIT83983.1 hypothetical protein A374_18149 [Fictibacillus macauensis ZFHKF-1]
MKAFSNLIIILITLAILELTKTIDIGGNIIFTEGARIVASLLIVFIYLRIVASFTKKAAETEKMEDATIFILPIFCLYAAYQVLYMEMPTLGNEIVTIIIRAIICAVVYVVIYQVTKRFGKKAA